ncbi:MAG: ammonia channel protein, partial [Ramlibacter sp.]
MSRPALSSPVFSALLLALGLSAAHAQTAGRSVQAVPQRAAPAAAAVAAPAGVPGVQSSPGGLT